MFKILNCNKGQASMSQYVIVFFLAIGSIVAMTTFVQRALQARIRDTKLYMIDRVQSIANVIVISNEYEPYYTNVSTIVDRNKNEEIGLIGGGATGIFRKNTQGQSISATNSEQAPPKDFNKT